MVSYEELIYEFVDIYLRTAVECSICKENYEMADDEEFLEQYLHLFIRLSRAVDNDNGIELSTLQKQLHDEKEKCLKEYWSFLEDKVMENALEHATKEKKSLSGFNEDIFVEKIQEYHKAVFTDEFNAVKESPVKALEYIRDIEERL